MTPDRERLDDLGNARRLVRLHGEDLLYAHPRKRWHVWDGWRWAEDEKGEAERRAKDVIAQIYSAAATEPDETRRKQLGTWAVKSSSAPRLAALLEVARSERELAVTGREFDQDPWRLTVLNGTLDLQTGELHPHRRADLITKLAPVTYDAAAQAPKWTTFLQEILGRELASFLQRAVGYALKPAT
jgi:putative DNA primase/helicase